MLDFILGLLLAGVLVRGWTRGFVREGLDLVGLVAGIWIAFKLSGPLGEFLVERFSVAPEIAVIGAGIVLFFLFGVSMSIAAHYLSRVMSLPGLTMINRFGGAAVGALWAVALLLVIFTVVRTFPLPDGWLVTIDDSTVVEVIAGPEAIPQQAFEKFAPDDVFGSVASLRSLFGSSRVVPEGFEVLSIPPAPADELRQVRQESQEVLRLVNEFRAGEGIGGLDTSLTFTEIAEKRARLMYESGRISRDNPPGQDLSYDLLSGGVKFAVNGEDLALASSARAAFEAMLDSDSGRAQMGISGYDRVGIAVLEGPNGRLVVIDFGG